MKFTYSMFAKSFCPPDIMLLHKTGLGRPPIKALLLSAILKEVTEAQAKVPYLVRYGCTSDSDQ